MFTGIIEHCVRVSAVSRRAGAMVLTIELGELATGTQIGDSISINGVCLTVTTLSAARATFDLSEETVAKTTLGRLHSGSLVNGERALVLGSRLGGHLVSGHVDGVGTLTRRQAQPGSDVFTFALPAAGTVRVIEKGSLAIDGISLTTFDCTARRCSVALIPHTLAQTTLGAMAVGASVNLEQDLIGRWVESLVKPLRGTVRRRPA